MKFFISLSKIKINYNSSFINTLREKNGCFGVSLDIYFSLTTKSLRVLLSTKA